MCPSTHPYAFDNGSKCCSIAVTSIASGDCKGSIQVCQPSSCTNGGKFIALTLDCRRSFETLMPPLIMIYYNSNHLIREKAIKMSIIENDAEQKLHTNINSTNKKLGLICL